MFRPIQRYILNCYDLSFNELIYFDKTVNCKKLFYQFYFLKQNNAQYVALSFFFFSEIETDDQCV